MEKLTVIYSDNGKLVIKNKKDGVVFGYYDLNVHGNPRVKSAIIQKYPLKAHTPIVLVDNGKYAAHYHDGLILRRAYGQ